MEAVDGVSEGLDCVRQAWLRGGGLVGYIRGQVCHVLNFFDRWDGSMDGGRRLKLKQCGLTIGKWRRYEYN